MGKVKTVAISGGDKSDKTIMSLLLICPVNERVCVCVCYFIFYYLLSYLQNGLTAPPFKKKKTMCKGTISAVYQSKCASATMSQISI